MTESIFVNTSGDCWNNPAQVREQLNQYPLNTPLQLDMCNEGPCLELLGITSMINDWLKNRKQSPYTVQVRRWNNPVEFVPYRRFRLSVLSHYFEYSQKYWQHTDPTLEQQLQYQQPFGIFIGRLTMSRAAILYKLLSADADSTSGQIFASLMQDAQPFPWKRSNNRAHDLEDISAWLSTQEQIDMFDWFDKSPISSVDSKSVGDQFDNPMAWINTNSSLVQYYNRFAVEIVCETYTLGNTFFPTEKTVRPLMAAKPILVYGPQYYLARLRGLGFRTYGEIWDESYDLYQGPARWDLMRKSMNRLLECSRADQHAVLGQAYEIAMHNRRHLDKIRNHQIDLSNHDYTTS